MDKDALMSANAFRNVDKYGEMYQAAIYVNNKNYSKSYNTSTEAAQAFDDYVIKHNLTEKLNFPKKSPQSEKVKRKRAESSSTAAEAAAAATTTTNATGSTEEATPITATTITTTTTTTITITITITTIQRVRRT
jgi:hypothetical protein